MDVCMPVGIPWTEENKKQARDLWMQGYSALYIGDRMGRTRRSVIGQLHRLGLMRVERPKNPAPLSHGEKRFVVGRKPIKALLGHKRSDGTPVSLKDIPMPEPSVAAKTSYRKDGKITLMELRSNSCRWPLGDPLLSDFGYCGAQTDGVCAYCLIHRKVAFYSVLGRRTA